MTELQRRKFRAKQLALKNLLALGWTTDKVWWTNPRSGFRYTFQTARAIEELRRDGISI